MENRKPLKVARMICKSCINDQGKIIAEETNIIWEDELMED